MLAGIIDPVSDDSMSNNQQATYWKRYALLLVLAYLVIYILPLGVRPVMIPDEVRYAEIPREMMVSGNWVSPHLNGLRYFEKPVLGYWVTGHKHAAVWRQCICHAIAERAVSRTVCTGDIPPVAAYDGAS